LNRTVFRTGYTPRDFIALVWSMTRPPIASGLFRRRLVTGRVSSDSFALRTASGSTVVVLRGEVSRTYAGTEIHVHTETILRTGLAVLLVVSATIGGLVAAIGIMTDTRSPDVILWIVVPMVSLIFVGLVCFAPPLVWAVHRHHGHQARWLLGYVEGLATSQVDEMTAEFGPQLNLPRLGRR
jgi:hypothetical protein